MRAITINQYGDTNVFQAEEMPVPAINADQLLVKIHASSLNPKDIMQRKGAFYDPLPAVLHSDFAGTVEAVGDSASDFKVGDKVYGCAGGIAGQQGSLADFIAVDAVQVAKMPANMDFVHAAALPLVAITAWEGLIDKAQVKSGDKVLVHGGTGGVGHIALQLAKTKGAVVSTTVGEDTVAAIASTLGANNVFNYKSVNVTDYVNEFTEGNGFDIVFDPVGGSNFANSVEAARFNGHVISTQMFGEFNLEAAASKALSLDLVLMLIPLIHGKGRAHHGEILKNITKLVEADLVKPLLHKEVFNFSNVGLAHQALENGKVTGKLVLINDSWE
ncbi:zinc-binding dehydrogenase [Photobacterium sp. SDRW27]|uniref:zinc-binding dehydrogenase n=1 Tax=Photobacterium obscurum TaxID=2829490 RepID=UPI002244EF71|nr:zinc-binding dehydrogenase [Photobacterium obscurum]MCW8329853.1 zinc-binding dehydrogenase [Photobacterium obscurum]